MNDQPGVISINRLIESELEGIREQILTFAATQYRTQLEEDFAEILDDLVVDDQEEENFYRTLHGIWYTLFEPQASLKNGTIIEDYLAKNLASIKRTRLKAIVKTWSAPVIVAGKVTSLSDIDGVVQDIFSGLEYTIRFGNSERPEAVGDFVMSMLLPYEERYLPYPSIFDIEKEDADRIARFLRDEFSQSGYETPEAYLSDYFIEILNMLPVMAQEIEIDDYQWSQPLHKEVARIFNEKITELGEFEEEREYGVSVWNCFCQIRPKSVKNPAIYAAALHYFMQKVASNSKQYTQKEIAELYQVSKWRMAEISLEISYIIMKEFQTWQVKNDWNMEE
jgi:hypothetical protein